MSASILLVTDTHPLIWYIGNQHSRLPKKVLAAFRSAQAGTGTYIWVPAAVVWEMSVLMKKTRRVTALASLAEIVNDDFYSKSISVADQLTEDLLLAHSLDFSKDPFDALIVATALRLELPLITADGAISEAKPCPLFWE